MKRNTKVLERVQVKKLDGRRSKFANSVVKLDKAQSYKNYINSWAYDIQGLLNAFGYDGLQERIHAVINGEVDTSMSGQRDNLIDEFYGE